MLDIAAHRVSGFGSSEQAAQSDCGGRRSKTFEGVIKSSHGSVRVHDTCDIQPVSTSCHPAHGVNAICAGTR